MDKFTLTDKTFCTLVRSIHLNKNISHIKVKAHGNSMAPFLKTGETLFIKPVNAEETIRTGDIIAVTDKNEEKIIVHRVINMQSKLFETKGDNCKNTDGWLKRQNIIGIVKKKTNLSGKTVSFNGWENRLIAFFSKTGILNTVLLPFGRLVKQKLVHTDPKKL